MRTVVGIVIIALAVLAFRRYLWAYCGFVILSLLAIPSRTGFRFFVPRCELILTPENVATSLANYPHIILFCLFFCMTLIQFPKTGWKRFGWAALVTLLVGAIVELQQGATRSGNCQLHDLVPNTLGIILGVIIVIAWEQWRKRPA